MSDIDYAGNVINAFNLGQQQRDRTVRRNALADYSRAGDDLAAQQNALQPLVAMGDFETVGAARDYRETNATDRTRRATGEIAGRGDYAGASRAAAGAGQVELAAALQGLDRSSLDAARVRGERGAAVVYAALGRRGATPQETADLRRQFLDQHTELASELGIPPEALAQADLADDSMLRAIGDRWQDASKLAGEVSMQRFGDNVQTVRTDAGGSAVIDSREIPQTRAEQFEQRQFQHRVSQDQGDDAFRRERAEAEDTYRKWQMENSISRSDIEGQVLAKAIREGRDGLTPEEQQVYDRAVTVRSSGMDGLLAGMGGGAPAPATGGGPASPPAPQPGRGSAPTTGAGTQANPARPQSDADFARLPDGAFFVDPGDGKVYQK